MPGWPRPPRGRNSTHRLIRKERDGPRTEVPQQDRGGDARARWPADQRPVPRRSRSAGSPADECRRNGATAAACSCVGAGDRGRGDDGAQWRVARGVRAPPSSRREKPGYRARRCVAAGRRTDRGHARRARRARPTPDDSTLVLAWTSASRRARSLPSTSASSNAFARLPPVDARAVMHGLHELGPRAAAASRVVEVLGRIWRQSRQRAMPTGGGWVDHGRCASADTPVLLAAIGAGLATVRAHVRRWRQPPRA